MLKDCVCPACGKSAWESIGSQTFHRNSPPDDAYTKLRYRVLFEVWGRQSDLFEAHFSLCASCGFVTYFPRATPEEVAEKYQFLLNEEPQRQEKPVISPLDERRSRSIQDFMRPYLVGSRLLDFGGGTGSLSSRFAAEGYDCGVVDYVSETVPEVARLGKSLDDLPPGETYDGIIASHVLEHLADPEATARQVRQRLSPCGIWFVEVPLELSGGPPKMREPVTHVNFFCESSLRALLERADYEVLVCRTVACHFQSGALRYAVRAVARPTSTPVFDHGPGAAEARALLGASKLYRLKRAIENPAVIRNSLRSRLLPSAPKSHALSA